jgi:hypothetical protein
MTSAAAWTLAFGMMPGVRERTADEFRALFAKSGFELTRIVPTKSR